MGPSLFAYFDFPGWSQLVFSLLVFSLLVPPVQFCSTGSTISFDTEVSCKFLGINVRAAGYAYTVSSSCNVYVYIEYWQISELVILANQRA